MESSESDKHLGIYLNDHLAGATGGLSLARRARSNSTDPQRTSMWNSLCGEVEDDRQVLVGIIDELGFRKNYPKLAASLVAERMGRLKLNGQLTGNSPLGQFLELEMMLLGVTGKRSLWQALAAIDDDRLDHYEFQILEKRAESQIQRLEAQRVALGKAVFAARSDDPELALAL